MDQLYKWDQNQREKEQKNQKNKKKAEDSTSSAMHLQQAILADRLHRKKLAEKEYRKCVDEGSSLFGWWRLLTYYAQNDQPKAVLVCIAEILDRAEEDGITEWEDE